MSSIPTQSLTDHERTDWLRLIRCENVGPMTFRKLLERYGSPARALEALPDLAAQGGRRDYRLCTVSEAEREVEQARRAGIDMIAACEPDYPTPLKAIPDAPPILSVKGHRHLLQRSCVAIVGARNASANGRSFARKLATGLGNARVGDDSLTVVSGLARGIDTSAHEGSLETGTVAVIAGGLDHVYPPENAALMERIARQGAIVAERPLGTEPRGRLFPLRNRLIAGLSMGIVVVEASPRSGSLITARHALDQGREVFAVPGAPGDPRTAGANELIRNGAWLTESAEDVLEQLPTADGFRSSAQNAFDFRTQGSDNEDDATVDTTVDEARHEIRGLLGPSPITVDELVRNCQVSPAHASAVLLELELAGRLERLPGNRVQLLL